MPRWRADRRRQTMPWPAQASPYAAVRARSRLSPGQIPGLVIAVHRQL